MASEVLAMPTLRRNGKPPSCEPCRKSKYSCDHVTPVCQRCQRRGIASRCTYHPAPMKGITPRVQKVNGVKRLRSQSPQGSENETERETAQESKNTSPKERTATPPRLNVGAEPGFLGSTSYNAVLTENGLGPQIDIEEAAIPMSASVMARPRRLKEAIAVLDLLADFEPLANIVTTWERYEAATSIIGPFVKPITADVRRDVYEKQVWKSGQSLIETAEALFRNTDRRVRVTKSDRMSDYYKYYTGSNLRWEAFCVFFTACGLCCNSLRYDEALYAFVGHTEDDRQDLMYRLMQASNACISFCEDAGQLSDLAVWALLENGIYNSQVLGDAHYLTWRKIGDVSTAIFAQGLHQESKKDTAKLPFWMVEMRRRALGSAYAIDKLLCTFVGRPPRISQRYCLIRDPLDLEYTELALEPDELEVALNSINEQGWNTNSLKETRKSVYNRCFVLVGKLREEVLELSLGPPQADMLEKARDIITRNQELMESLPEYVRFRPGTWERKAVVRFFAAQEYLDILYNEFMIRRMMIRQFRHDPDDLLKVARQILEGVLEASTKRYTTNDACVPWMAILYGLPAAAVLALDLLKPLSRPSASASRRSKTIQDLSVFIASLKWVHAPGEGNYQICDQARKTLQQVLDKVLAEPPSSMATPSHLNALPSPLDSGIMSMEGDNGWDLSWLDSADFDADFWMNLPDHPLLT